MSRHAIAACISLAFLVACGGGGGSSSPGTNIIPQSPTNKSPGTVKLSFKIPNQSTMARVRRPFYTSQATLGVAIDWVSTDPTHPDYAAAVSLTCPTGSLPSGVTCTTSSTGTVYDFQLAIPIGIYPTFTVSAFDATPGGTTPSPATFLSPAHMLAQGQIAGGLKVAAGNNNNIALTFYGIPASINFGPAPSQSHVTQMSGGYGIIGSAPQTFVAQAVDADGFAISSNDSGAPVLTVAESASDSPQEFTMSKLSNFTFSVQAKAASPTSGTAGQITVTAAPQASAIGINSLPMSFNVTAIPELWFTMAPSGGPTGTIYGFALSGSAYTPTYHPIDQINTSYLPGAIAVDASGNLWVTNQGTPTQSIQEYNAESNSNPPVAGSTITQEPSNNFPFTQVVGLAVDALNHLWVADSTANFGEVTSYNISSPASPAPLGSIISYPMGSPSNVAPSLGAPVAMTIAPATGTLPTALQGSIWVYSSSTMNGSGSLVAPSTLDVLTANSSGVPTDTYDSVSLKPDPLVSAPPALGAMAVAPNGSLWYADTGNSVVAEDSIALSGSTISLTANYTTLAVQGFPQSVQYVLDPTGLTVWTGSAYGAFSYNVTGGAIGSVTSLEPNCCNGNIVNGLTIAP